MANGDRNLFKTRFDINQTSCLWMWRKVWIKILYYCTTVQQILLLNIFPAKRASNAENDPIDDVIMIENT